MKVTASTLIGEVLRMSDKAAEVLMRHGMGCIGCPSSQSESIEQAAAVHGLDVNALLADLNKEIGE
jgi:hydrid cluster protein-associated redox disulfide domain